MDGWTDGRTDAKVVLYSVQCCTLHWTDNYFTVAALPTISTPRSPSCLRAPHSSSSASLRSCNPDGSDIPDGSNIPGGSDIPVDSDIPDGSDIPGGSDIPDGSDIPGTLHTLPSARGHRDE